MILTVWPLLGLFILVRSDRPAASSSLIARRTHTAPMNFTNGSLSRNDTQVIEGMVANHVVEDMDIINRLPPMENASTSNTSSRQQHGFGELTKSLEFVMLKLAQLETIAELQQAEIHTLKDEVQANKREIRKLKGENVTENATDASMSQLKQDSKVKEAQEVFQHVVKKHLHQRSQRKFVTPYSRRKKVSKSKEKKENLVQRAQKRAEAKDLDDSVSGKWVNDVVDTVSDTVSDVGGAITDGTGLVGDALSDAYNNAADQVSFVANTVIDTVEMAVNILINGFTDWDAGCPGTTWPSMSVNSNGISVDWGRQNCFIRLMGQSITIMNFDFGDVSLNWPEPIKTITGYGISAIKAVVEIGKEVASCASAGGAEEIFKCFGNQLLSIVPPLNFLNRIGDLIQEFIETFAHIAAAVIRTVLRDSSSLVQTAVNSSFPAVGAAPVIHHAGKNMMVKTHSQRRPGVVKPPKASVLETGAKGDDDEDEDGAITFEIHDNEDNYATKLITQFAGKEIDTSSCLAFAPKTRRGVNNKVTQRDWQVAAGQDFIQLEPWAVPCDNSWMKDNPEKWEGYSFYTWQSAIEKCVTVSYSMSTQPVLAFVGGLEFDLLPAPLTEMETTVCWPDKQPGGVDLSMLRTVIKSGGVQLFSRTLRLIKRFGSGTDFVGGNIFPAHETWRNPIGVATGTHGVEDDRSLQAMSREASLLEKEKSESKKSKKAEAKVDQGDLLWSEEELYVASMDYDRYMNTTVTKELRDSEARERLRLMQSDDFELFSFTNPGLVSFGIKGILKNNELQLGMQVSFGPFDSPEKRITLVNIVDHFKLVLAGLPFVSVDSRIKAINALENFTVSDVPDIGPASGVPIVSGTPTHVWASQRDNIDYLRFPLRVNSQFTPLWNRIYQGDMTWEVMMRFMETPRYQTNIMGTYEFANNQYSSSNRRRSLGLFVGSDGKHWVGSTGFGGTPAKGPNLFSQRWHHIVLVLKRSGQASYYIDGVKMNSFTYTPGSENIGMDGSITIGGGHLGRNFQNEVSRFAIWSRAWSDADVAAAATCSVNTQGLEVLYTLDGGYEDLKGNQNDLQRALSKGVFAACSNCQFCPSYPLGSVSVR